MEKEADQRDCNQKLATRQIEFHKNGIITNKTEISLTKILGSDRSQEG